MRYFFSLLLLTLVGCSSSLNPPPKTVTHIDLKRYAGTWYEIASFPNSFQKGCRCTQAQYALKGNRISVVNKCIKGASDKYSVARGRAWVPNSADSGKLKVRFFWPFSGDYWVLAIDPSYQVVLVGNPSRRYLWILARKRKISVKTYNQYKNIAKEQGYGISKLKMTDQKNCIANHTKD